MSIMIWTVSTIELYLGMTLPYFFRLADHT